MKIARIEHNGQPAYGYVEDERINLIDGDIFGKYTKTDISVSLEGEKLLAPCVPGKVIAVGLNYSDHAKEMGKQTTEFPVFFLKANSSVVGHEDDIIYPCHYSNRVDFEAELAIVIGKRAKHIEESEVHDYILGYTCLNDVTARDLQKIDGQWARAKSFDTFCPIGPFISDELDPSNAKIQSILNGEVKQDSNTSQFIHKLEFLVSAASKIMTLEPGDIIATGTPEGIGEMKSGDVIEIYIEGIGTLRSYVK